MPFPAIRGCIVCEDVRIERSNLLSILGFYGIIPNVEIIMQQVPGAVRLTLLFVAGTGEGTYEAAVRIRRPNGEPLSINPPLPINLDPTKRGTNIGFSVVGFVIPEAGTYTVELLIGGTTVYADTFAVRPAQPGEIQV